MYRGRKGCFQLHNENKSGTSYGKIAGISGKGSWNLHEKFKTTCCNFPVHLPTKTHTTKKPVRNVNK